MKCCEVVICSLCHASSSSGLFSYVPGQMWGRRPPEGTRGDGVYIQLFFPNRENDLLGYNLNPSISKMKKYSKK